MSFGDCYRLETALIYGVFILGNSAFLSPSRACGEAISHKCTGRGARLAFSAVFCDVEVLVGRPNSDLRPDWSWRRGTFVRVFRARFLRRKGSSPFRLLFACFPSIILAGVLNSLGAFIFRVCYVSALSGSPDSHSS